MYSFYFLSPWYLADTPIGEVMRSTIHAETISGKLSRVKNTGQKNVTPDPNLNAFYGEADAGAIASIELLLDVDGDPKYPFLADPVEIVEGI